MIKSEQFLQNQIGSNVVRSSNYTNQDTNYLNKKVSIPSQIHKDISLKEGSLRYSEDDMLFQMPANLNAERPQ